MVRYCRNVLDRLVRWIGEGHWRSEVHALKRDARISHKQAHFVAENPRDMVGPDHLAQEAEVASVDHGPNVSGDQHLRAQGAKRLLDLPQARDGVESGDENPPRRGEQRNCPRVHRERQIDDDVVVSMSHAVEQGGQGLDVEIADVKSAAARSEDVQSARMAANESAQQLVVQTPWRSDNLIELKLGRDIEIVADVA